MSDNAPVLPVTVHDIVNEKPALNPSRASGVSIEPAHGPTDSVHSTNAAVDNFRSELGIPANVSVSFYDRIQKSYSRSVMQYRFVATLANGLLWVQIVLGAALTALGATDVKGSKTATIFLAASSTVISGLLTYFKSRGQPNRCRMERDNMQMVRDRMEEGLAELKSDPKATAEDAQRRVLELIELYNEAMITAQENNPDTWSAGGPLRSGSTPKTRARA